MAGRIGNSCQYHAYIDVTIESVHVHEIDSEQLEELDGQISLWMDRSVFGWIVFCLHYKVNGCWRWSTIGHRLRRLSCGCFESMIDTNAFTSRCALFFIVRQIIITTANITVNMLQSLVSSQTIGSKLYHLMIPC